MGTVTATEPTPFKRCTCCKRPHSASDWARLDLVGHIETEDEGGRYRLELRNCDGCLSTIGIEQRVAA